MIIKTIRDGIEYYLHAAYATSDTGENFSLTEFEGATFIGHFQDRSNVESSVYTDYMWKTIDESDVEDYLDEDEIIERITSVTSMVDDVAENVVSTNEELSVIHGSTRENLLDNVNEGTTGWSILSVLRVKTGNSGFVISENDDGGIKIECETPGAGELCFNCDRFSNILMSDEEDGDSNVFTLSFSARMNNLRTYAISVGSGDNVQIVFDILDNSTEDDEETPTENAYVDYESTSEAMAYSGETQKLTFNLCNMEEGDTLEIVNLKVEGGATSTDYTPNSIESLKDIVIDAINVNKTAVINSAKIGELEAEKITSGEINTDILKANVVEAINLYVGTAKIQDAVIGSLDVSKLIGGVIAAEHIDTQGITADVIIAVSGQIAHLVVESLKVATIDAGQITTGWLATERLLLTGNEKDNYPKVKIDAQQYATNPTAYYLLIDGEYIRCNADMPFDPDAQYYIHQSVKAIVEAINQANSPEGVIVSNDKLIAASIDVGELSALTADLGTVTAGVIQNGNNIIDVSGGQLEFKDNEVWEDATAGIKWDGTSLNIKAESIEFKGESLEGKLAGKVNIGESGIDNMAQVFRWDPDNGLTIGNEGGEFKTVLSSTELAFYQGDNKVAYINNNKLHINETVVIQGMDVGTPVREGGLGAWSWKVHDIDGKNNLYLKWLG